MHEEILPLIQTFPDEKVSELIEKYRKMFNDYDETKKFIFNLKNLDMDLTCAEEGLFDNAIIFVENRKRVKGGRNKY